MILQCQPRIKLVIADYSQEEARIIAGLTNDEKAIELSKRVVQISGK